MNEEARFVFRLWETVQEFVPNSQRNDAAVEVLRTLIDQGYDLDLIYDLEGDCPHLDHALEELSAEHEPEIDEEEM